MPRKPSQTRHSNDHSPERLDAAVAGFEHTLLDTAKWTTINSETIDRLQLSPDDLANPILRWATHLSQGNLGPPHGVTHARWCQYLFDLACFLTRRDFARRAADLGWGDCDVLYPDGIVWHACGGVITCINHRRALIERDGFCCEVYLKDQNRLKTHYTN